MDRLVKFIAIPIELWTSKELSCEEKFLLFEIDSFTKKGRDCYMSDEYIATFLNCSESTAKRLLKRLIERGFVRVTRKEGKMRYIETCIKFGVEGQNEPQENSDRVKMTENGGQNEPQPIVNDLLFPPIVSDNKLSSTIDPQGGEKSKRFVKPSIDEIKSFAVENGLAYIDPSEFFDFYESKGWRVGNAPMKDWHAAARRWNRTNSQRPGARPVLNVNATAEENKYPDGVYYLNNFSSKQEVVEVFRFERELCKRVLQGLSVRRVNGKWVC